MQHRGRVHTSLTCKWAHLQPCRPGTSRFKLSDFDSSDSEDEYSVDDYVYDETTTYDKKKSRAAARPIHGIQLYMARPAHSENPDVLF